MGDDGNEIVSSKSNLYVFLNNEVLTYAGVHYLPLFVAGKQERKQLFGKGQELSVKPVRTFVIAPELCVQPHHDIVQKGACFL